ncbi:hypothetical protein CDO52_00195 [Nocardiopsis gilva YIM 90087]|uniref:Head-tail adaptor protein n=1 Tax=Nocardiopsis gilva YIM 90087 TaxID=1235441 RepID=A0A223RZY1_9ACTN|nr:head-tail adaptor protein [Nocardiopsis gilva]ASU81408.1 hypothetical protein CDO52_00195 [Nocardiopsis gilva YIM 90087]
MSLLDRGEEFLDIFPEVTTTDDLGNVIVRPADEPVRIRASVQPVTSDELSAVGQDLATTYRVICRSAPLGAWSRVRWVTNGGTWWDVIGRPRRYGMSRRTAHIDALIRERKDPPESARGEA